MTEVFRELSRQTNVQLEDPLLTELHRALVMDANYPEAERIITHGAKIGLFDSYLQECDYTPMWHCVKTGMKRDFEVVKPWQLFDNVDYFRTTVSICPRWPSNVYRR
jgi:hypothetical protein